jgi:Domain of unknown function (DUF4145)
VSENGENKNINKVPSDCIYCGNGRNAQLLFVYEEVFCDEHLTLQYDYQTLKCLGCDNVSYRTVGSNSLETDDGYDENGIGYSIPIKSIKYYPSFSWKEPEWLGDIVDTTLGELMNSIYVALNADIPILAAIGIRTAWDRAIELLGVDGQLPFQGKLEALKSEGEIGVKEHDYLKELIDAGHAAAHRGWKPNRRQLATMVDMLESFLNRAFIIPAKYTNTLEGKVPKKLASAKKTSKKVAAL